LFLAWRTVGENPLLSDLIDVARGCASINPN
jgi:hypothetical protein